MGRIYLLLFLTVFTGCDRIKIGQGKQYVRKTEKQSVDCDLKNGRRPRDGCVTGPITCGETIEDNTKGGEAKMNGANYKVAFCAPFDHHWEGKERIYLLEMPPETEANIWLDSDCEDLDLFAMRWNYTGTCPTTSHTISECEADDSKAGGMVHLETVRNTGNYLVIVDGKEGVEAPFRLTVECQPR